MEKRFSKSHEWVEFVSPRRARVGISNYAQKELGDIVFVELPEEGKAFKASEQFGTIESTKSVSELFMPIGGKVAAVNKAVLDNPALINQAAESQGWLVEIEADDPAEIDGLLTEQGYQEFIAAES